MRGASSAAGWGVFRGWTAAPIGCAGLRRSTASPGSERGGVLRGALLGRADRCKITPANGGRAKARPTLPAGARDGVFGRLCCEAFGLVAEEAVDEAFDEFSVLVGESLGGF